MLRISLSLLLVSLVLGMDHSTDDHVTGSNNVNPESALTNSFRPRRRQQQPYVEIREVNAGRYFRRRPQTTTVSSIFSMKVEDESQHVYPNMSTVDNIHVQAKQKEINMTDTSTPTPSQNFPPTTTSNNPRPNNVRRRVPYRRTRRPSSAQTPSLIIQQTEKTTELVVTSTTTAPIVDTTKKEQEKYVLPTSDSKSSNEVPSLEKPHPSISQIPEEFIQRMKDTAEEVFMSTSNAPVVISTTEKEPEKLVFTPSTAHDSNVIHFVKRRRPIHVQKTALPENQQKEANEEAIDSTTAAPVSVSVSAIPQDNMVLSPFASYVSDIISMAHPKPRRLPNRGSYKYNRNDMDKDQPNFPERFSSDLDSNSSQLTSTTKITPPPVPTLSPWYDGFGK